MNNYQNLFDEAIGTPPPSTVDLDTLIVRQRRRVRVQQAGVVACAGAATLAIALVLTLLPRAGAPPDDGDPVAAAPSATVAGSATPGVPPTTHSPAPREAEAARLTAALRQIMAGLLPTAQFLPLAQAMPNAMRDYSPAGPLVFVDSVASFKAIAAIRDPAGTGAIYVTIGQQPSILSQDPTFCDDPPPLDVQVQCETKPLAGGAMLMAISTTMGPYKRHLVEVARPDGNTVTVEVTNGASAEETHRPGPPLTREQTISLAKNPALATVISWPQTAGPVQPAPSPSGT